MGERRGRIQEIKSTEQDKNRSEGGKEREKREREDQTTEVRERDGESETERERWCQWGIDTYVIVTSVSCDCTGM